MIDLSGLADGAVSERFQLELQRVLENIADPNTDPKKARTLTLTLTLNCKATAGSCYGSRAQRSRTIRGVVRFEQLDRMIRPEHWG